jgi:3-hydroxyacyl-[acyl-carrier-protein] dehydratase
VLSLTVKAKRAKMPLATFEGSIRVGQEKAAVAEEITLTFAYVEATAIPPPPSSSIPPGGSNASGEKAKPASIAVQPPTSGQVAAFVPPPALPA